MNEFAKYPKIYSPFKRFTEGPDKNKLDLYSWYKPEFYTLQHAPWIFSEKVDGTNIRVGWDGYQVFYAGRTDKAQIPAPLLEFLQNTLYEELFEQQFGSTPAILYGEGYGGKIQDGGKYRPDEAFTLFDVKIGRFWLKWKDVVEVAHNLGIDNVPYYGFTLAEAIDEVSGGWGSNYYPDFAEGLVGVPDDGLLDRAGQRVQVKIKHNDFYKVEYSNASESLR